MRLAKYSETMGVFIQGMSFYGAHWLLVSGLMMAAALARVGVVEGFGPVPSGGKTSLEVITEAARIALVLAIIGGGSIVKGIQLLPRILTSFNEGTWRVITSNLAHQWLPLLLSIVVFSVVAGVMNFCINLLANETVLQLLKDWHLLAQGANIQAIVLFLKNLTVIPFTIFFLYYIFAKLVTPGR